MKNNFYETFEQLCRDRNMSPTQVCKTLNLSHGSITHWRNGKIPRYETLDQLAHFFHVSIIELLSKAKQSPQTDDIPVYGDVSCGTGVLADDLVLTHMSWPNDFSEPHSHFFLIAKGISMTPKIENGDRVLIHKQSTLESGQIGVMLVDEAEGFLKKFIKTEDSIQLVSINPTFPPIVFKGSDMNRVRILGKFEGLIRGL